MCGLLPSEREHFMRTVFGLSIIGIAILAMAAVAAAQEGKAESAGMSLELNKLEDRDSGCRAYLVFDNRTDAGFDSFKLDLVLFGTDGVIIRRMAVEAAPLRPEKKAVKLFDIAGTACGAIGSVLVNDILGCHDAQGDQSDCISRLTVGSRVSATMMK
jgi:hypothetical protein